MVPVSRLAGFLCPEIEELKGGEVEEVGLVAENVQAVSTNNYPDSHSEAALFRLLFCHPSSIHRSVSAQARSTEKKRIRKQIFFSSPEM